MVSGTLALTTAVVPLVTTAISGNSVKLQVIGAGTVIFGGKAGVTAGNGCQIGSANGPVEIGAPVQVTNLADVYVTSQATATLMWVAN